MSCYIYFYLKKKDTPMKDWHICLAHLCTSDARELSNELESFDSGVTYDVCYNKEDDPMYGHYTPLTKELLNNTINYYDSKVRDMKDSKAKYEEISQKAEANYLKASNKAVLEDIKETIRDAAEMISWCDEEIERFTSLRYRISNAVRNVLEENNYHDYNQETSEYTEKNNYELVYYMG